MICQISVQPLALSWEADVEVKEFGPCGFPFQYFARLGVLGLNRRRSVVCCPCLVEVQQVVLAWRVVVVWLRRLSICQCLS